MKIVHITSPHGGPGRQATGLCNGLAKLGTHTQELVLVDKPGPHELDYVDSSVKVRVLSEHQPPISRVESMARIASFLSGDIIHVHFPSLTLPARILSSSSANIFCTLHGHPQPNFEPSPSMKLAYSMELLCLRLVGSGVKLITVSAFTSSKVSSIVKRPVSVIYPGIDNSFFIPSNDQSRAKKEVGLEGKIVLLFVGRLHPVKDPFTLVRAVASLSRPNVCLVIVGEGPLADQTRSLAMSLGVEVKFISRVSTPSLIRIYQASDVFVLSSISEAAGLVLIEAMACGLPIVASAIEGIPEIVGDVGLLVGPGDHAAFSRQISAILDDDSLRQKLAEGGRARAVLHFSEASFANQHLKLYAKANQV